MTRRHLFAALALIGITLCAPMTFAATPSVEIIAMPHPPVISALQPLRAWLTAQKIRVSEIDAESDAGVKRLASVGLSGHIPVVILINGHYRHRRADGSPVALTHFPNIPNAPAMARGEWVIKDVQALLRPVATSR
ncbi:MAG: hypothetical protein D4R70_00255 [Betaproteobacteria bacterium]|nr:MAG: hypothetical protein D4R70_00255 [Betaproteobacteria bacterium]